MIASSFNGCGGCSKSGLKDKSNRNSRSSTQSNDFRTSNSQGKTIVKMETESGVKYIWIEINGLRLKFFLILVQVVFAFQPLKLLYYIGRALCEKRYSRYSIFSGCDR
jgi:hypothetical protein